MIHRDTIILIIVLVLLLVFLIYQKKNKEGFCLIGCGSTTQSLSVASVMDVINSNITNSLVSAKNSSNVECTINQNIKVLCRGCVYDGCNINAINNATSNCNNSSIFTSTSTNDMKSMIKQAIDNSATTNQSSVQGFLSTTVSDQNNNISISTHIKNLVEKNFTNEMFNLCKTKATVNQNNEIDDSGTIYICRHGETLNYENNGQMMVLSNCISKQLTTMLVNDSLVNDAINNAKAGQSSENKGLDDFVNGLLAGITGPMKYALIVGAIIVVVAIIGGLIFLLSPAGQDVSKKVGAAAADKIKNS